MSSAGPLIASTSCQPPVVSWRFSSVAGRLIGTSLRPLHSPIGNHPHLTVVHFVATAIAFAVAVAMAVAIAVTIAIAVAVAIAITITITIPIAVAIAVTIALTVTIDVAVAVTIAIAVAVVVAIAIKQVSRDDQQCQGTVICTTAIIAAV
jgi:hypothetical protein